MDPPLSLLLPAAAALAEEESCTPVWLAAETVIVFTSPAEVVSLTIFPVVVVESDVVN
jgi:hypothetical protein